MSRHKRETSPLWLRVRWLDKDRSESYEKENIVIIQEEDSKSSDEYLVFRVNNKTVLDDKLRMFQWLSESSTNGIAALKSRDAIVLIKYDYRDRNQRTFFEDLEQTLEGQHHLPPRRAEEKWTVDDLINTIQRGSPRDAELAATYLAKNREEVSFQLFNEEKQKEKSVSSNSLELKLRIEYQNCDRPMTRTIFVPKDTTLETLKKQVASEASIRIDDQFWFAGEQHSIEDNYVFGSGKPVSNLRRGEPPSVRSGDTLILYIASTPPMKC